MTTDTTLPPRRRWLQFRLRTLLAAMLLCGLALAFWSIYIQPYRHEAWIIDQLQVQGVVVTTETEGPAWLRAIAGDEFFRRIVQVEAYGPQMTDEQLQLLTEAPRLRLLVLLDSCKITDAGLRHLAAMKSLKDLTIFNRAATDEGLRHVSQHPRLEMLNIRGPFSDVGVRHLSGLSELRALALGSPHLTDEGLAPVGSLVELRDLRLFAPITDAGMIHLLPLTNLDTLVCTGDPAKARVVATLEEPTHLEFIDCPLGDAVEFISDAHAFPVRIDAKALQTTGRDPMAPVTLTVTNVPLRDALTQMLAPLQLDWLPGNNELLITTQKAAAETRPNILALHKKLPKLKQVHVQW